MRRVWNARLLGAGLCVALVAALAVAGAASARGTTSTTSAGGLSALDYPTVIHIDGAANKTCDELDAYGAEGASWLELKFDSDDLPSVGSSKTLSDSYLSVTLTQTATDVWSWTSTQGVDAVFVKSGVSGHNLYVYDPPAEATSGSGLTVPGKNGTSHVSFCYDKEQTPPNHGKLKVVKLLAGDVPEGAAFGDFSYAVDGGAAVAFDADGVSDELEFAVGTSHDVVEPEANGEGYTTTYSDDCSDGVIVAGQTIVCTITNIFHPGGGEDHGKLKVVKVLAGDVPEGVTFGDFSYAVDGGPAVAFDTDGVSDELDFVAGTSHDVVEPEANGEGYTTSYSDECSDGVIVVGQTIVCTITNTFHHGGGHEPGALHISKTAAGHFDVQHTWTIDKQVKVAGAGDETYGDNAALNLPDGGAGSFTWKVTVGHSTMETNFLVNATIEVSNPNEQDVDGVSVSDPNGVVDCSPDEGAQSAGLTVPANGSITCSFVGVPESKIPTNTATVTWGNHQSATATATIAWSKGADIGTPAVVNDDGALDDEVVDGPATFTYDEAWTCHAGTPSPNAGRTNTATVVWDGGSDSDRASVAVACGHAPPPPPPPPPPTHPGESMDVQIVKDATPQVELVNHQADVTYTIVVRNAGPNQAHNVVVSDAAPSGVTFLAVVTQPVNGSCTVTPVLLDCSLGTLGPGVERTIVVSARVIQTGTYSNCATVVGEGGDTNPANNTDCAETLVTAPITPPVVTPPAKPKPPHAKPKPKPKPTICRILKVRTKMVKANGERHVLVAKVTRSRNPMKGVKVRFKGAGVTKAVRTNKKGMARISVRTTKAGIIRVNIVNAKACNTARIGVVGVFQPPVTG